MGYQILSLLLYSLQNITNKTFARRFPSGWPGLSSRRPGDVVVALILALAGRARPLEGPVLLLSLVFGVVYILTIVTLQAALAAGPMGATILLNNIYMIFPVVYSILFFEETVTPTKLIGIACMLAVTVLSAPRDKKLKQNRQALSLRWFLLTLATTLCNGVLTILKRSLSWYFPKADSAAFTFWGFLTVAAISWLIVGVLLLRKQDFSTWTADPKWLGTLRPGRRCGDGRREPVPAAGAATVPAVVVLP